MPFSLIIPTYKRPVSLARAVGSGLAQTVKPAEVIVIGKIKAGPWLSTYCRTMSEAIDCFI